jgi:hypothetical protein
MRTHQLMSHLMMMLACVVVVEAGTKKAPPKEPPAPLAPLDQLTAKMRQGDPRGLIVTGGLFGDTTDDVSMIATNAFDRAHDQEHGYK